MAFSGRALARGMANRCARCGARGIFRSYYRLHPTCRTCGMRFERESGEWTGALMIIIAFTEVLFALWFGVGLWVTWPDVPWTLLLIGGIALNLVVPVSSTRGRSRSGSGSTTPSSRSTRPRRPRRSLRRRGRRASDGPPEGASASLRRTARPTGRPVEDQERRWRATARRGRGPARRGPRAPRARRRRDRALTPQLAAILRYAEQVGEVAADDVEPMTHPLGLVDVLRDDVRGPGSPPPTSSPPRPIRRSGASACPRIVEEDA
jgi:aspartyl-tRNA(Asn)/glutamyl-tRNA(Gln) amidotransferase subunit C